MPFKSLAIVLLTAALGASVISTPFAQTLPGRSSARFYSDDTVGLDHDDVIDRRTLRNTNSRRKTSNSWQARSLRRHARSGAVNVNTRVKAPVSPAGLRIASVSRT